ncbi:hypothetical protein M231_05713 [Tremella mesenterica]|uniref:Uncharacterized protein n=1 Tax=Tremella mesenterica TaxID=5217 RepID=A0A4Q1BHC7_TREME|nr:hypothetical protein M231_05713 [Tremella mesenterica]
MPNKTKSSKPGKPALVVRNFVTRFKNRPSSRSVGNEKPTPTIPEINCDVAIPLHVDEESPLPAIPNMDMTFSDKPPLPPFPPDIIRRIAQELLRQNCRASLSSFSLASNDIFLFISPILYRNIILTDSHLRNLAFVLRHRFNLPNPSASKEAAGLHRRVGRILWNYRWLESLHVPPTTSQKTLDLLNAMWKKGIDFLCPQLKSIAFIQPESYSGKLWVDILLPPLAITRALTRGRKVDYMCLHLRKPPFGGLSAGRNREHDERAEWPSWDVNDDCRLLQHAVDVNKSCSVHYSYYTRQLDVSDSIWRHRFIIWDDPAYGEQLKVPQCFDNMYEHWQEIQKLKEDDRHLITFVDDTGQLADKWVEFEDSMKEELRFNFEWWMTDRRVSKKYAKTLDVKPNRFEDLLPLIHFERGIKEVCEACGCMIDPRQPIDTMKSSSISGNILSLPHEVIFRIAELIPDNHDDWYLQEFSLLSKEIFRLVSPLIYQRQTVQMDNSLIMALTGFFFDPKCSPVSEFYPFDPDRLVRPPFTSQEIGSSILVRTAWKCQWTKHVVVSADNVIQLGGFARRLRRSKIFLFPRLQRLVLQESANKHSRLTSIIKTLVPGDQVDHLCLHAKLSNFKRFTPYVRKTLTIHPCRQPTDSDESDGEVDREGNMDTMKIDVQLNKWFLGVEDFESDLNKEQETILNHLFWEWYEPEDLDVRTPKLHISALESDPWDGEDWARRVTREICEKNGYRFTWETIKVYVEFDSVREGTISCQACDEILSPDRSDMYVDHFWEDQYEDEDQYLDDFNPIYFDEPEWGDTYDDNGW